LAMKTAKLFRNGKLQSLEKFPEDFMTNREQPSG